jgi:hypothetical protein
MKILTLKSTLRFAAFVLIVATILSTTGCLRYAATGPKYDPATTKLQAIPSGHGRLFLYILDGGPNIFNYAGYMDDCTVDRQMHSFLGKTYWFVDLPAGHHRVTADGVRGFSSGYRKASYGKYSAEFDILPAETKYCHIELIGFGSYGSLKPVMVEESVALRELRGIPFFKDSMGIGLTVSE